MRAHSIELRTFQIKKPIRTSNETPEAYSSVSGFFSKVEPEPKFGLRRCQSTFALAKRPKSSANHGTQRLSMLQTKYRTLEQDYRRVLQEVKSRNEIYTKQKDEIDRLTMITLKQEKQIDRLKQLLRMSQKKNQFIQTEDQHEESSWRKRIQASTGESELTSETRCERSSLRKQDQSRDKLECRKNQKMKVEGVRASGKERAPLTKKYKFIPTLSFKHN